MSDISLPTDPVSANAAGTYGQWGDGGFGGVGSAQARRNSFNAGEFLFPESRWGLLPLQLIEGVFIALALRIGRLSILPMSI